MKKQALLIVFALCAAFALHAQELNWRAFDERYEQAAALHLGLDFGTVYGLSYGRRLPGRLPVLLGATASVPFGDQPFDDWKVSVNAQSELWHNDRLSFSIKPAFLVRRYQSDAARLYNTGAGITATFGYFRPKWGIATEAHYDRALFVHAKHDMLKAHYPAIRDGWYGSTGGNYQFGVKAHYAMQSWNVFLKIGRVYAQDFKDNPTLLYYLDLSLVKYLRRPN